MTGQRSGDVLCRCGKIGANDNMHSTGQPMAECERRMRTAVGLSAGPGQWLTTVKSDHRAQLARESAERAADHVIHGTCANEAANHDPHFWGDLDRFHCNGDVGVPAVREPSAISCSDLGDMPVEMVEHPAHYGGADDPYEVIKVCEAWGLDEDAYLFNVVKYVGRPGKGNYLEDLKKARFYLNRRIAKMEKLKTGGAQ